MLSGHSLGGALAQLAAHDIATAAREQMTLRIKVICYTYGSPRVGNHSFAREYDKLVPHTWHLVNDQVSGNLAYFDTSTESLEPKYTALQSSPSSGPCIPYIFLKHRPAFRWRTFTYVA